MFFVSNSILCFIFLIKLSIMNTFPIDLKLINRARQLLINENNVTDQLQSKTNEMVKEDGCKDFWLIHLCLYPNTINKTYLNEHQGKSRQMTVSMDTQNLNVYDGILLSGSPSLTVWTSYNTRGEKTFGIDITEYIISFIER